MTDTQREAIAVLSEAWELAPDIRLGQLMAHLGFLGEVYLSKGLGDIEDDELIAVLYRHRSELAARLPRTTQPIADDSSRELSVSGSPMQPEAAFVA